MIRKLIGSCVSNERLGLRIRSGKLQRLLLITVVEAATAFGQGSGSPSQDAALRSSAEVRILMLSNFSIFDMLHLDVQGGTVTVSGTVMSAKLKDDALKAVGSMAGVTQVSSDIRIVPPSLQDDQIRLALYEALRSDAGLMKYFFASVAPLHLLVERGAVVLAGKLDNQADVDKATSIARAANGVTSVKSEIRSQ